MNNSSIRFLFGFLVLLALASGRCSASREELQLSAFDLRWEEQQLAFCVELRWVPGWWLRLSEFVEFEFYDAQGEPLGVSDFRRLFLSEKFLSRVSQNFKEQLHM